MLEDLLQEAEPVTRSDGRHVFHVILAVWGKQRMSITQTV
jgi:hypothetical protein